jgi:hypothetical protein
MDKDFVLEILQTLYRTEEEILKGNFCFKIFIEIESLNYEAYSYYTTDMRNMVERIYFGYSNYGQMKKSELLFLFESHLKVVEEIQIVNMIQNISLENRK